MYNDWIVVNKELEEIWKVAAVVARNLPEDTEEDPRGTPPLISTTFGVSDEVKLDFSPIQTCF
jgi:hypothetical protein